MENLGSLALLVALCLSAYSAVASTVGGRKLSLIAIGGRAVYAVWLLITVASAVLLIAFQREDYRFAYVAANSSRRMPWSYKLAAWWGGQEGSRLFWSRLLSGYAAAAVFLNRLKQRESTPYTIAALMATLMFFLVVNAFAANPFRLLAVGLEVIALPDGMGLNPLLQYPLMRIHPPILNLGYVGMTVPFAFGMGALIARRPGDAWIGSTRRWTLVTWLFQGAASCSARSGLTRPLAGAGIGRGTRWRTLRCCRGSARRCFCTRPSCRRKST
jgi:cytochrome c-type biogenesis protein CcmF